MIRKFALPAAIALASSTAYADCTDELATIDRQLAEAALDQPQLTQVLQQIRNQGAAACEAGNESSAGANFTSISMMLELQAQQGIRVSAEPVSETQAPAKAAPAAKPTPKGGSGLLPYVVVHDPEGIATLDWPDLRKSAATNYPSRWDDLTLVDSCLWISPDELADYLGLTARLSASSADFQCKYRVHLPNGNSGVFLSVYVELHPDTKYPREAEAGFASGPASMQFTPFDPGTADLKVYLHKKSRYLYAFPANGRSYWRLGYKPSYGLDGVYTPPAGSGIEQDVGPRFLKLLVEKYGGQL